MKWRVTSPELDLGCKLPRIFLQILEKWLESIPIFKICIKTEVSGWAKRGERQILYTLYYSKIQRAFAIPLLLVYLIKCTSTRKARIQLLKRG